MMEVLEKHTTLFNILPEHIILLFGSAFPEQGL